MPFAFQSLLSNHRTWYFYQRWTTVQRQSMIEVPEGKYPAQLREGPDGSAPCSGTWLWHQEPMAQGVGWSPHDVSWAMVLVTKPERDGESHCSP